MEASNCYLKSLPVPISKPVISKVQTYKNTTVTRVDPKVVRRYGLYSEAAEFEQYATEIFGSLAIILIVRRRSYGLNPQGIDDFRSSCNAAAPDAHAEKRDRHV